MHALAPDNDNLILLCLYELDKPLYALASSISCYIIHKQLRSFSVQNPDLPLEVTTY
jgi:hypothetical protein